MEEAEAGLARHKLIFLDVDGVLNGWGQIHISLVLAARLLSVVRASGAEIVLSSMWRLKALHRRQVRAAFLAVGLPRPIGYTPRMRHGHARAAEILAWLRLNTVNVMQHEEIDFPAVQETSEFTERHYLLPQKIICSHYCALDDLDLGDPAKGDPAGLLASHFVRTPARYGLTEHNAQQALTVLSREVPGPVTLLISAHCEQCGRSRPTHAEARWNKFFCNTQCRDAFVL